MIYWRPQPRKQGFYWLEAGSSYIVPFNNIEKCYNRKQAQRLWSILYNYSKVSGKKFITCKHLAGIQITRIV